MGSDWVMERAALPCLNDLLPRAQNMQLDTCGKTLPSKSLFLELKKTLSGHSCDITLR